MQLVLLVCIIDSGYYLSIFNGHQGHQGAHSANHPSFCKTNLLLFRLFTRIWQAYNCFLVLLRVSLTGFSNYKTHQTPYLGNMFSAPCPYSSLSNYDWAYTKQIEGPSGCSALVWNPVVFFLFAAFQVCTIYIGVDLHVQLFYMFRKKKTLYFW
jgi:hypothetical protein